MSEFTSSIRFYANLPIRPEKNFSVDDIDDYLASLPTESVGYPARPSKSAITSNFMYIRPALEISIKIRKEQLYLELNKYAYNYMTIQHVGAVSQTKYPMYYYFIVNARQIATDTLEFDLRMDVLNTFKWGVAYEVSKRTRVIREHKDRFHIHYYHFNLTCYAPNPTTPFPTSTAGDTFKITLPNGEVFEAELESDVVYNSDTQTFTFSIPCNEWNDYMNIELSDFITDDSNGKPVFKKLQFYVNDIPTQEMLNVRVDNWTGSTPRLIRVIDLKSEQIPCSLYKKFEYTIRDWGADYNWCLYYKNHTANDDVIDCYLVADEDVKYKTSSTSKAIDVNDIPVGKTILIAPSYNVDAILEIDGEDFISEIETWEDQYDSGYIYKCFGLANVGGTLVATYYSFWRDYGRADYRVQTIKTWNNPTIIYKGSQGVLNGCKRDSIDNYYQNGAEAFPPPDFTFTFTGMSTITLANKTTIDKTLEENLKIINIPYIPSDFILNVDGTIDISEMWTYDSTYKFLKLTDFNYKFQHLIRTDTGDFITNAFVDIETYYDFNFEKDRFLTDSKLFHSDFYVFKFVSDSFSTTFPLEKIDYLSSVKNVAEIGDYDFCLYFYMSRNIVSKFLFKFYYVYKDSTEDYENIVAVARNNEEVLYSSAYLNYVRTGYNYDLKQKERQEQTGALSIGLSVAGMVASGLIGVATGNYAISGAGIVAGAVGLANSLVSYAKTTAQNEDNIQRKLEESKRQAVSVLNADDFDLLQAYSGNRAKMICYETSQQMKSILGDLFHYCGYSVDYQGIPNVSTRYRFNFLQCDLVINGILQNVKTIYMDEIMNKFRDGVSFIHHNQSSSLPWDFEQVKENWETSIINA